MKRAGTIESRLTASILDGLHIWTENEATIEEQESSGRALLRLKLPPGRRVIQWKLSSGQFRFLKADKMADGLLLIEGHDGCWSIHIFELKTSEKFANLRKASEQMSWTLKKALALAGSLNLELSTTHLYIAFQDTSEKMQQEAAGLIRPPMRPEEASQSAPYHSPALMDQLKRQGRVLWQLENFEGKVYLTRIQLNAQGEGEFAVAAP